MSGIFPIAYFIVAVVPCPLSFAVLLLYHADICNFFANIGRLENIFFYDTHHLFVLMCLSLSVLAVFLLQNSLDVSVNKLPAYGGMMFRLHFSMADLADPYLMHPAFPASVTVFYHIHICKSFAKPRSICWYFQESI